MIRPLLVVLPLALLAFGARQDGVPVEDRIDVIEVDRRLVAVVADRGLPEIELEIGEQVLETRSGGLVGVATTTSRLLGITAKSANWRELRYRIGERESAPQSVFLGDRVALVAMRTRLAALAPGGTSWNELDLAPSEGILRAVVDANLAGVITARRAIAFAAPSGFVEIPLRPLERVQGESVEESSWVLTTNDRLLIFRVGADRWISQRRTKR